MFLRGHPSSLARFLNKLKILFKKLEPKSLEGLARKNVSADNGSDLNFEKMAVGAGYSLKITF